MLLYEMFYRRYGYRKVSDIRKIFKYSELTELPNGAILHSFADLGKPITLETSALPDTGVIEKYLQKNRNAYYFVNDMDMSNSVVKVNTTGIRHAAVKAQIQIRKLRDGTHLLAKDPAMLETTVAMQSTVFYSCLQKARVVGRLQRSRLVEIALGKLIDIAASNHNNHFVIIPTEAIRLSPTDFTKCLREFAVPAYVHPDSYYFTIMMHLYAYLHDKPTDSIFSKVPMEILERINFIFVNEDTDHFVSVRLDRLKTFTEADQYIGKKLLHVLNVVSKEIEDDRKLPEIDEKLLKPASAAGQQEVLNVPEFKEPKSDTEIAESFKEQLVVQEKEANRKIIANKQLSTPQKAVAQKTASAYKKVILKDETLEQLITKVVPTDVAKTSRVDIVKVPDKSVTESRVARFAQTYVEQQFDKDMASILVSLSKHGMHVVDMKTEDISDDLNEITRYTVKFKDDNGESHTIKYRMPKIDNDGYCKINGSIKQLMLQRINTPICKISPTRVSISSSGNKTIVERNESFSNSQIKQIRRYLEKTKTNIHGVLSSSSYPEIVLPLDYVVVAQVYSCIKGTGINLVFDYLQRLEGVKDPEVIIKTEDKNSWVYMGTFKGKPCYIDVDNIIHWEAETFRLLELLGQVINDVDIVPYNEWVNVILLNKKFPVIFLLSYRYGFENILDYLRVDYEKIPKGNRVNATVNDVAIRLADVSYVLRDVSTIQRLIFSGMNMFNLTDIESVNLDERDAYYTIMESRGYSSDYLNHINYLFDMFLDPITIDVLHQMGEPTNMRDLLIRATSLLQTGDHKEAASSANFRYRSYEQFNSILYKVLSKELASFNAKPPGSKRKFSLSEYDVFTKIATDPMFNNVDIVNPMTKIKGQCNYTHIGDGGRSADSMMIEDRRYPKDGVGINGALSYDANIVNTRGLTQSKPIKDLTPSEILSPSALLYPGVTLDDSKRRFVRL